MIFKPLIHMGGMNDGKYRPAVFEDDDSTLVSLALMDTNWFMTEEEAQEICDAMVRAFTTGLAVMESLMMGVEDADRPEALRGTPVASQEGCGGHCDCASGSQGGC